MFKIIQLYVNNSKPEALNLSKKIKNILILNNYEIRNDNAEVIIGFGGDGTLLNLLREQNYNITSKYIGINCGTLGFMQDFDVFDTEDFVSKLPNLFEEKLNFVCLEVSINNKVIKFYALNEFYLIGNNDGLFKASIKIGLEFLEEYVGTGLIFSTPSGSTAHNISSIGSIIFPNINAILMTPSEAIVNSKIRCLSKSIVIPKGICINLKKSKNSQIKIISDGVNVYSGEYEEIKVFYSDKFVTKLISKEVNFIAKIRNKLI